MSKVGDWIAVTLGKRSYGVGRAGCGGIHFKAMAITDETLKDLEESLRWLLDDANAHDELVDALKALGVMPDGYCWCAHDRDPKKDNHTGECVAAKKVIHSAEARADE